MSIETVPASIAPQLGVIDGLVIPGTAPEGVLGKLKLMTSVAGARLVAGMSFEEREKYGLVSGTFDSLNQTIATLVYKEGAPEEVAQHLSWRLLHCLGAFVVSETELTKPMDIPMVGDSWTGVDERFRDGSADILAQHYSEKIVERPYIPRQLNVGDTVEAVIGGIRVTNSFMVGQNAQPVHSLYEFNKL